MTSSDVSISCCGASAAWVDGDFSMVPFWSGVASGGKLPLSAGVSLTGVGVAAANCRSFSRFFSSVRKNALRVVRSALLGLQRSGETGVCAQTGQVFGREAWPIPTEKEEYLVSHRGRWDIGMRGDDRTGFANGLVTAW